MESPRSRGERELPVGMSSVERSTLVGEARTGSSARSDRAGRPVAALVIQLTVLQLQAPGGLTREQGCCNRV
jgi:hypothetical protein